MFNFEKLNVFQEGISITNNIYNLTSAWPKEELFGLISQLRRASISIALNLAEGSSRTTKDFRHFIDMSRGSCYECIAILAVAKPRSYISEDQYRQLYYHFEKIARMLSALKKSLR